MSLVAVVFGVGSNVGRSVALRLKSEGYKVAIASRRVDPEKAKSEGFFPLPIDLAKPATVSDAYNTVVKQLGVPSVLVYNAAVVNFASPQDPFSPTLETLQGANAVNIESLYAAVQQFVKHGRGLPAGTSKTVIYTGNALNQIIMPPVVTLGIGKNGGAHLIAVGAASELVKEGFRFYFVDERAADGTPAGPALSGPAHAEVYWQLIKEKEQKPSNVQFVAPGKITSF